MIRIFREERAFVLRRPGVFVAWLLLTGLVILAMREGRLIVEARQQAIEKHSQAMWDVFEERRGRAVEVVAGTREVKNAREAYGAGRVNGISVPATLSVTNVQAWSPGLWDAHPTVGAVGVFTAPSNYLEMASSGDPEAEAWGRLDLTMVVVVLLPLWLLLVFHDTCSHERDRGLFRILEGNGVRRGRILARRLSTPVVIATVGWALSFLVGCLVTGGWNGVGAAGWVWFAASFGYAVFWMGCFAMVASRAKTTETSVTASLAVWVVIVILLPGLMDVILRASTDPAAATEAIARKRDAAAQAERERAEVLSKYNFDHPELAEGGEEGQFGSKFLREYFATQERVESELIPVIDQQDAESVEKLDFVQSLSAAVPSAWAQGLLEETAGTGPRQMLAFRRSSRAYASDVREYLRPFLWRGELLKPDDFDGVPRYTAMSAAASEGVTPLRVLWLPFLGVIGLILAWRRWLSSSVIVGVR